MEWEWGREPYIAKLAKTDPGEQQMEQINSKYTNLFQGIEKIRDTETRTKTYMVNSIWNQKQYQKHKNLDQFLTTCKDLFSSG